MSLPVKSVYLCRSDSRTEYIFRETSTVPLNSFGSVTIYTTHRKHLHIKLVLFHLNNEWMNVDTKTRITQNNNQLNIDVINSILVIN